MILLHLRARHFKGTLFFNNGSCGCAVEKALRETMNVPDDTPVSEGVDNCWYGDYKQNSFTHDDYRPEHFDRDSAAAELADYDDTIIRTIELHPVC